MNIFSSVKILDLTRVFSGPFATRHFADFGADVIKIESPQGDDSRNFPPLIKDWSGYFELLNRNKKSIVLDLKNENDLNKFYEMCKTSDVVVENFSSTIKKKLKIDFETLRKFNSKIIYASVNGISPDIDRKYYDVIAQAESGLISLNGEKEDMKISTSIVDAFSGMKLAFAISSALYNRLITGEGCEISVSMKGSAFDLLEQNLIETSVTGKNPDKVGNMDNAIAPFGIFKTKDGSIALAVGNEQLWENLSIFLNERNRSFNKETYKTNQMRITNISSLKKDIEVVFKNYSTVEVKKEMDQLEIPCGKIMKMSDVLNDKENFEQELLFEIDLPEVGKVIVPSGGIFFSNNKLVDYKPSPKLAKK